jgi:hypothetical protein
MLLQEELTYKNYNLLEKIKRSSVADEVSVEMSHGNKGKKKVFSEEHKLNISLAAKNKPPVTKEFRLKMSRINKGRKLIFTEEHRKHISESHKAIATDEFKQKMSIIAFKRYYPDWNGDTSQKSNVLRKRGKYKSWRNKVLTRDNYLCVRCGSSEDKLNAHHIKAFIKYPELRFDVDNGISLCKPCHKKEHRNGSKQS